jgi:hypothetical protein
VTTSPRAFLRFRSISFLSSRRLAVGGVKPGLTVTEM